MTRKHKILEELDEGGLLLERRVNEGLAANDRAKYYVALLGLAYEQAISPAPEPDDLGRERQAVRIDDAWLDAVIPEARREGDRAVFPRAQEVLDRAVGEARRMLEAVEACRDPEAEALGRRLRALERAFDGAARDGVPSWVIERVTSADRARGDGLHLLVMDAHRALNRIGRAIAREKIDGASVYGIAEEDREIVAAFMAGLARTAPLRFDHPGLDTTATRLGGRLVIQNDIGQTDAHIFILAVEGGGVEITYTDVHERRLAFFQSMLEPLAPSWRTAAVRRSDALPESSRYVLVRGTIRARDPAGLRRILETIGSRLPFLIDWNKARKRLRIFSKGRDAIEVLAWAAREEVGHMAFLKLGGEELVYEALELADPSSIRPGEPLYAVLGRPATVAFLKEVLAITSRGLREGESELLIRDQVKAAFRRFYRTRARGPLETCRELAGLVVEAALTIRDMLRAVGRRDAAFLARNAERLRRWEASSDARLNRLRKEARAHGRPGALLAVAGRIDDAQDDLEEAGHLVTLLEPDRTPAGLRFRLEGLADLCVRAAQEGYKAVASAEDVHTAAGGLEDFSRSIDRLDAIAHGARQARRDFRGALLGWEQAAAARVTVAWDLAMRLADAADSLARAGFALHEAVFEGPAGPGEGLE